MSTYYFMVCVDHLKRCDAASQVAGGGVCQLGESVAPLLRFIVEHCGCRMQSVSEHDIDSYSERFADSSEVKTDGASRA